GGECPRIRGKGGCAGGADPRTLRLGKIAPCLRPDLEWAFWTAPAGHSGGRRPCLSRHSWRRIVGPASAPPRRSDRDSGARDPTLRLCRTSRGRPGDRSGGCRRHAPAPARGPRNQHFRYFYTSYTHQQRIFSIAAGCRCADNNQELSGTPVLWSIVRRELVTI